MSRLVPVEVIAASRMAYGPRPGDVERIRRIGLVNYVDEQLSPQDHDDSQCETKLRTTPLHIEYEAGEGYPARKWDPPLTCLNKTVRELWPLADYRNKMAYEERVRPLQEVRAATRI